MKNDRITEIQEWALVLGLPLSQQSTTLPPVGGAMSLALSLPSLHFFCPPHEEEIARKAIIPSSEERRRKELCGAVEITREDKNPHKSRYGFRLESVLIL